MVLYLITFFLCFIFDSVKDKRLKQLFLIWLFLFFCFGYTVGADWRQYEILYTRSFEESLAHRNLYILYDFINSIIYELGIDFWLYSGIVKCLFFYYLICIIKIFTNRIYCVIGLMIPAILMFMLIDCPFKFMMAMILVLAGLRYFLERKWLLFIFITFVATFIHFAIPIISLLLFFIYLFKDFISKLNVITILVIFFCSVIISTSFSFFSSLTTIFSYLIPILEGKTESYGVESTAGWLVLGNLISFLFLFLICISRRRILSMPNGNLLFACAVASKILFPILLIIPTGFRFNMLNNILYIIAISSACFNLNSSFFFRFKYREIVLFITISYSLYSYVKDIWTGYSYLPYTNSIPYIILGNSGDNFNERSELGYKNYYLRTGQPFERD